MADPKKNYSLPFWSQSNSARKKNNPWLNEAFIRFTRTVENRGLGPLASSTIVSLCNIDGGKLFKIQRKGSSNRVGEAQKSRNNAIRLLVPHLAT